MPLKTHSQKPSTKPPFYPRIRSVQGNVRRRRPTVPAKDVETKEDAALLDKLKPRSPETAIIPPALDALPIRVSSSLKGSVQFYLEEFCPAFYQNLPQQEHVYSESIFESARLRVVQNELELYSTLALTVLIQDLLRVGTPSGTRDACHCRVVAYKLLRQSLSTSGANSTSALRSVMTLVGVCNMTNALDEAELHLKATNLILAKNFADSEDPTFYKFCKRVTVSFENYYNNARLIEKREHEDPSFLPWFIYPTLPLSEAVCKRLAKFPPALTELCLKQELSFPMITLIDCISTTDQRRREPSSNTCYDTPYKENLFNAALAARILISRTLSYTESLLGLACLTYMVHIGGNLDEWWIIYSYVQVQAFALKTVPGSVVALVEYPGLLVWAASIMKAAFGSVKQTSDLADHITSVLKMRHARVWEGRATILWDYFWSQQLDEALDMTEYLETKQTPLKQLEDSPPE